MVNVDSVMMTAMLTMAPDCIQDWFDHCARERKPFTSPMTGLVLAPRLISNVTVRDLVGKYIKEKKAILKQQRRQARDAGKG